METRHINIIKKIIVLLLICLISCTFAACDDPLSKLEGDIKLKPIEGTVNMFYDTTTKVVFCLDGHTISPCGSWVSGNRLYWDGCNIVNIMEDM